MIVRKHWSEDNGTITVEFSEDEPRPEAEDILYFEGEEYVDCGVMVGSTLYDKFGVVIYEVLETGIPRSYEEL